MTIHIALRIPHRLECNSLSSLIDELKSKGTPITDLTESNPTRTGLLWNEDEFVAAYRGQWVPYAVSSQGDLTAREAIAAMSPSAMSPDDIFLTASTSESYALLFKLLCDAGDRVLIPRPSYPLLEHLARLEGVEPVFYDLVYEGRWAIDLATVTAQITSNARAIVVINPNNPTGSYLKHDEYLALATLCRHADMALISDEVFFPYLRGDTPQAPTSLSAYDDDCVRFTLDGFSKRLILPQLKLGWITVSTSDATTRERIRSSLNYLLDNYLSVATPTQQAAAVLLKNECSYRAMVQVRLDENERILMKSLEGHPEVSSLFREGGWYAVLRFPYVVSEEEFVVELLREERVLVHPGYFYEFQSGLYVVVSLIVEPKLFQDAVSRMIDWFQRRYWSAVSI